MAPWNQDRRGYAMLLAMLLIAILAVIGATTLSIAGVDQRIALHNRKHMMVMNTGDAGTEHARYQLEHALRASIRMRIPGLTLCWPPKARTSTAG